MNRLTWEATADPTFSHYNVYSSPEPIEQVSQELLRGSPTYPELIDWRLRADTRHYYAATAVGRRNNESRPAFVQTSTPARTTPENTIEPAFAEGDLTGSFQQSEADGLRGPAYVIPQNPFSNRVSWEIDVPEGDDYYFWLRYLHGGDRGRGGQIRQEVNSLGERGTGRAGQTDLNKPDELIDKSHPLPITYGFRCTTEGITTSNRLPAGGEPHKRSQENLHGGIRNDVLLLTYESTFTIPDGQKKEKSISSTSAKELDIQRSVGLIVSKLVVLFTAFCGR